MIAIEINGEKRQVENGSTVSDLLEDLGIGGRRVAVERNREIVSRELYGSTVLAEGDVFEVIEFVGGGF